MVPPQAEGVGHSGSFRSRIQQSYEAVGEAFSPAARACVGYGVAFAWKIFNEKFASMNEFRRQSHSRQLDFIETLINLETMTEKNDPEVALGVELTKLYISQLIEGNEPMANRMAEQLEPLNREGAILLGSVPTGYGQTEDTLWNPSKAEDCGT